MHRHISSAAGLISARKREQMAGQLSEYAYGKIKIRVMKVNRERYDHDAGTVTVGDIACAVLSFARA